MSRPYDRSRRRFIKSSGILMGSAALSPLLLREGTAAPGIITLDANRPQLEQGIQIGDVSCNQAMIWSRSDRPARMFVEYDTHPGFKNPTRVRGPHALETTDYTARLDLIDLPCDREIHVRVSFQDLSNDRLISEPVHGSFVTAPRGRRDLRFTWSGDTAG
ncbi:MAG: PhoD-like phosphatase N-terminal domain-containing protein, partial [Gammaproteobacteria bacterium]|nr:PhoD-like phosphatase N-terminal domain-containing protein [Gammaproteobacteria bacterium]